MPPKTRQRFIILGIFSLLPILVWWIPNTFLASMLLWVATPQNDVERAFLDQKVLQHLDTLKVVAAVCLWILLHTVYFGWGSLRSIPGRMGRKGEYLRTELAAIPAQERFILVAIVSSFALGMSIVIAWFPVHYDEAYTIYYFIEKGPLVVVSLYQATNNHIFYNLLASVAAKLLYADLVVYRMLSLFFAVSGVLLCYVFWRKKVGVRVAQYALILLLTNAPFCFYSTQARGYMALFFFSTLSFTTIVSLENQGHKRLSTTYLWVSILGFYTIPTYLLVFLSQLIYLMFLRVRIGEMARVSGWILLGVSLLYLPVFLISGYDYLLNNPQIDLFRAKTDLSKTGEYLAGATDYLFVHPVLLVLVIGGSLLSFGLKKVLSLPQKIGVYFLIQLLLFAGIPFVLKAFPPDRIFIFLVLPYTMLLAVLLDRVRFGAFFLLLMVALNLNRLGSSTFTDPYLFAARDLYLKLVEQGVKKVHFYQHPTLRALMQYDDRRQHRLHISFTTMAETMDDHPFSNDEVIFSQQALLLNTHYLKEETDFWKVYYPK